MQKPIIAIKVPTLGETNAALASFLSCISASRDLPYEFEINYYVGYRPHDYARNCAIRDVFENERIAKVWFLDSDTIPDVDTLKLLRTKGDIVSGLYNIIYRKDDGLLWPVSSAYATVQGGWTPVEAVGSGVSEVDAVGMGCMIIDRKVLLDERMWLDNPDSAYVGKKKSVEHILFRHSYNPDGSMATGEDIGFCERAKSLGYRILVDSSVWVGHLKEFNLLEWKKSLWTQETWQRKSA